MAYLDYLPLVLKHKFGTGLGIFELVKISSTIDANSSKAEEIPVDKGYVRLLLKMRFGNITRDKLKIRFEGITLISADEVLISDELLNWPIEFYPLPQAKTGAKIIITNTDTTSSQSFNCVFDTILIPENRIKKINEILSWDVEKLG